MPRFSFLTCFSYVLSPEALTGLTAGANGATMFSKLFVTLEINRLVTRSLRQEEHYAFVHTLELPVLLPDGSICVPTEYSKAGTFQIDTYTLCLCQHHA